MVNLAAPPAIIFVNADLSDNVKAAVQRQLFINETITGSEFDSRISVDSNYPQEVHGNGLRILVIRSFDDYTNRDLADIVLFIKAGLAAVEQNKYGPPGQTFQVDHMYPSQLFHTS